MLHFQSQVSGLDMVNDAYDNLGFFSSLRVACVQLYIKG